MKRFFYICSIFVFVFLLTSCGTAEKEEKKEKDVKLTCKYDMSKEIEEYGTWSNEIKLEYGDNNLISKASLKMIIDVTSESSEESLKKLEESLGDICASYSNCKLERNGKTIVYNIEGAVEELLGNNYSNRLRYDEAKEMLEEDGFTCK